MIEVLQEFDFQVVHRPGEKHGNADAISWQTTREPEWQEGEEEATTGSCPEPMNLETAISKLPEQKVFLLSITEHSKKTWPQWNSKLAVMKSGQNIGKTQLLPRFCKKLRYL